GNSTLALDQTGNAHHEGHPSIRIDQVDANLDGSDDGGNLILGNDGGFWLSGLPGVRAPIFPDVILLHLGTNDCFGYFDPTQPNSQGYAELQTNPQAFARHAADRLDHLIGRLVALRPQTYILVAGIIPYSPMIGYGALSPVAAYNRLISTQIVPKYQRLGARVSFVDQYAGFLVPDTDNQRDATLYGDMVHPNDAGYKRMAQAWEQAIESVLPAPPPAPVWRAVSAASGPDGKTRLLWDNANGTAALWDVDEAGGTFSLHAYGPFAGWTASKIAVGPDNQTRLLWNNAQTGVVAVWSVDDRTGQFAPRFYGPYVGWSTKAIAVGTDNQTRLLWDNNTGQIAVWDIDNGTGQFSQFFYGPYDGWTATSLSVGPDNKTRILWNHDSGQVALWDLDNGTGRFTPYFYGPDADWTATAVSVGADGMTRLLWNNGSSQARVWDLDEATGLYRHFEYGPYPGWSANALSVGTDGRTRLLWDNADGTVALWDVSTGSGSFTANFFGPY
ncbi:MAG: GDSL-type esterase/lipase family protein, partial [Armatimonadota bacterium]|nr:GDSL-type esterase/lipase family protein [Armatimonadota bacterium]